MTMTTRLLPRLLPMLQWWPRVDGRTLRADALAGFTGAIVLVPQAVAYAAIAGVPPQYGLYTAIVPVIVAALFGSSMHLVSGPTAALSLVIFATVSPMAAPGSDAFVQRTIDLTFVTGALMFVLGVARVGLLVNFISHTVVVGFTAGAAVLIAASQLKNLFGLATPSTSSFVATLAGFADALPDTNGAALAVGLVTLAAGIGMQRWLPRVPYMIGAMAIGSVFAAVLQQLHPGVVVPGVGAIPRSLPPLSMPALSWQTIHDLGAVAVALAMLSLTEAVAIARAIALKSGQRIDANQEFIGQGLANLFGSFTSSYVSSGSFTRSGLNHSAGAVTPMAAVFSAVLLLLTLLVFAPVVRFLPIASMAAILLLVARSLVDLHHVRTIARTSRAELLVLLATFAATLFMQLEFAIYVGMLLSLMVFLERTTRPTVRDARPAPGEREYHFVDRGPTPECPQLKIVFLDGPLYFGAIDHVQRHFQSFEQPHLLVLAPGIGFIDSAGAELLAQEARRRRPAGGLHLHRLQPAAAETLRRAGALDVIDARRLYAIGDDVITRIVPLLDADTCNRCTRRVFRQCPTPP